MGWPFILFFWRGPELTDILRAKTENVQVSGKLKICSNGLGNSEEIVMSNKARHLNP
jgi:hypothetical protein